MCARTVQSIKRSQRESLLYQTIAQFFLVLVQDVPRFQGVSVNRVQLSANKSVCTVFFYSVHGKPFFAERMKELILYKPSLRTAIAHTISSRYAPELVFKYDDQFHKQEEIERLLDTIKAKESL